MGKIVRKRKPLKGAPEEMDYRDIAKRIKPVSFYNPETFNACFYGKAGTGKTTLASTLGSAVYIDSKENGTDSVSDVKNTNVLRTSRWKDFNDMFWYLKKEKHGYETAVIDTASRAQDFALMRIMEDNNKEVDPQNLGQWGTMSQKMWGQVATEMKIMIDNFCTLPMNVIFLAHERIFEVDAQDEEGEDISPSIGPALSPAVSNVLCGAVDIVGNTFIRENVRKVKVDGKTKTKKDIEYCLRIGPDPIYITKIRKPKKFKVPKLIIDPEFSDLVDIIQGTYE